MAEAEERCAAIAATQNGLIHRRQAFNAGLSGRQIHFRLATGRWVRHLPMVFRIAGSTADWFQALRGLSLWAWRGFALSHASAAALWELPRFRPGPLEISVLRHGRLPWPHQLHQVKALGKGDVVSHRSFVVTSPARTLVDLCQTEERATIESSFDDFLRRECLDLERLARTLERHVRSRGIRVVRALLERHLCGESATDSELEFRALEILDQQGLPRPEKQVWVTRDRRVDFIYPREKIVVEIDSRAHHFTPKAQEEDAARSNELVLKLPGFLLLRWTSLAMKTRPHALARELRLALDRPVLVPYDAA